MEYPPIERLNPRRRLVPTGSWRTLFVPGLVLVSLISLLYLGQTSDVASTGYDIVDLQTEQHQYQMKNEQLRFQIAQLESLDRIDHEASSRLHMGPPNHVVYVTAPRPVLPTLHPTATPDSHPSPTSLIGRLVRSVVSAISGPSKRGP